MCSCRGNDMSSERVCFKDVNLNTRKHFQFFHVHVRVYRHRICVAFQFRNLYII